MDRLTPLAQATISLFGPLRRFYGDSRSNSWVMEMAESEATYLLNKSGMVEHAAGADTFAKIAESLRADLLEKDSSADK